MSQIKILVLQTVFLFLILEDFGNCADRVRRYPEHLDPFPKFWVRIGECPTSLDGIQKHFCPTPTPTGKWICVDDYELCDGVKNCPNAEDESSDYCMFYKVLRSKVDFLAKSFATLKPDENSVEFGDNGHGHSNMQDYYSEEPYENRYHRQSGIFFPALK